MKTLLIPKIPKKFSGTNRKAKRLSTEKIKHVPNIILKQYTTPMPFTISESNNQNQMRQQLWNLGAPQSNNEQIRNVATFGFHGFENVQNGGRRLILLTKNNSFCQASKTKTKTFVCPKSGKQCTTLVLNYTTAGWKHVCSFGRLDLIGTTQKN